MSYSFAPLVPPTLKVTLLPRSKEKEAQARERHHSVLVDYDATIKHMLHQCLSLLDSVSDEEAMAVIKNDVKKVHPQLSQAETTEVTPDISSCFGYPQFKKYSPQKTVEAIDFIIRLVPPVKDEEEGMEREFSNSNSLPPNHRQRLSSAQKAESILEREYEAYHRAYCSHQDGFRNVQRYTIKTDFLYPCHLYYYLVESLCVSSEVYMREQLTRLTRLEREYKGDQWQTELERYSYYIIVDFFHRLQSIMHEIQVVWGPYDNWLTFYFRRVIHYHLQHGLGEDENIPTTHCHSLDQVGEMCMGSVLRRYPSLVDAALSGSLVVLQKDLELNEPTPELLERVCPSYYPPHLRTMNRHQEDLQGVGQLVTIDECYAAEYRYPDSRLPYAPYEETVTLAPLTLETSIRRRQLYFFSKCLWNMDQYSTRYQPQVKQLYHRYYQQVAEQLYQANTLAVTYFRYVAYQLKREEERCTMCFPDSIASVWVCQIVEQELVEVHGPDLVRGQFEVLLYLEEDYHTLRLIRRFFSHLQSTASVLASLFNEFIAMKSFHFIRDVLGKSEDEKNPFMTVKLLNGLIHVGEQAIERCFGEQERHFTLQLHEALHQSLARRPFALSQQLTLFLDYTLLKVEQNILPMQNPSNDESNSNSAPPPPPLAPGHYYAEQVLDTIGKLFSFHPHKHYFETLYWSDLVTRLLNPSRRINLGAEFHFLRVLKATSGTEVTSKFKAMLYEYEDKAKKGSNLQIALGTGGSSTVFLLTSGYWRVMDKTAMLSVESDRGKIQESLLDALPHPRVRPVQDAASEAAMDPSNPSAILQLLVGHPVDTPVGSPLANAAWEMYDYCKRVTYAYTNEYKKRVLRWQYHISSGDLFASNGVETFGVLRGSITQCFLLLLFEQVSTDEKVSVGELLRHYLGGHSTASLPSTVAHAITGMCYPEYGPLQCLTAKGELGNPLDAGNILQLNPNFPPLHFPPTGSDGGERFWVIPQPTSQDLVQEPHSAQYREEEYKQFQNSKDYLYYDLKRDLNEFYSFEDAAATTERRKPRASGRGADHHATSQEREKEGGSGLTEDEIERQRKSRLKKIEIQVVHWLKKKQKLAHKPLLEVVASSLPFIAVTPAEFKQAIEMVLMKGYVKRGEGDTYAYCP